MKKLNGYLWVTFLLGILLSACREQERHPVNEFTVNSTETMETNNTSGPTNPPPPKDKPKDRDNWRPAPAK
ncbi:hypothetical protein [Chryseobacterium sp. R2A-55]|uniref:hypothetical protein n=1 Tax=Chryseobacterium sp. R2A-55 TaxID=2744445 RepID=UPI001F173B1D|nr:hypothetical protein [Chryseobacterium sp. R2A-55]